MLITVLYRKNNAGSVFFCSIVTYWRASCQVPYSFSTLRNFVCAIHGFDMADGNSGITDRRTLGSFSAYCCAFLSCASSFLKVVSTVVVSGVRGLIVEG